jgi:hypothetical protein
VRVPNATRIVNGKLAVESILNADRDGKDRILSTVWSIARVMYHKPFAPTDRIVVPHFRRQPIDSRATQPHETAKLTRSQAEEACCLQIPSR